MEETLNNASSLFSTEVICALITLAGVILANLSSRWIAKETAEREVERQKREWAHDNEIAFEQAFLDMVEAVSAYILDASITTQKPARVKTSIMLSFAEGELADKIEALYTCLKRRPALDAEEKLLDVIQAKRSHQPTTKGFIKTFFSFFCRTKP